MTDEKLLEKKVKQALKKLKQFAKLVKKSNWDEANEWVEDLIDWQYSIYRNFKYRNVELTLAWGGPNIYFDSLTGTLSGAWGFQSFELKIDDEITDAIDDYFENEYETLQGCYSSGRYYA